VKDQTFGGFRNNTESRWRRRIINGMQNEEEEEQRDDMQNKVSPGGLSRLYISIFEERTKSDKFM
jgi:hypothetical protein